MQSVATLASVLALAGSALAGQYTLNNHCGYAVTYTEWAPGPGLTGSVAAGASFSQPIKDRPDGGWSVKLQKEGQSATDVTQFEYTHDATQNHLTYDISFINASPQQSMRTDGISITPQSGLNSDCVVVDCSHGCPNTMAYFAPNDLATKTCALDTSLVVDLCSGNKKRDAEPREHARAFRYVRV